MPARAEDLQALAEFLAGTERPHAMPDAETVAPVADVTAGTQAPSDPQQQADDAEQSAQRSAPEQQPQKQPGGGQPRGGKRRRQWWQKAAEAANEWAGSRPTPGGIGGLLAILGFFAAAVIPVNAGHTRLDLLWLVLTSQATLPPPDGADRSGVPPGSILSPIPPDGAPPPIGVAPPSGYPWWWGLTGGGGDPTGLGMGMGMGSGDTSGAGALHPLDVSGLGISHARLN